jgi:hypothetical protein
VRRDSYHDYGGLATLAIATALTLSCGGRIARVPAPEPASTDAASLAPLTPLDDVKPLFVAGENITWEVTFRGIEGGRARMAVGNPTLVDGRHVLALRADAESSGLLAVVKTIHDDVAAWVDLDTGLPLRTEGSANTSGKELHSETIFDHAAHRAAIDFTVGSTRQKTGRRLPPGETYDPLGIILILRGWDAPDGARTSFATMGGRTLWRTELTVDARETRSTRLGQVACVRMTGVSKRLLATLTLDERKPPRRFTVWLTDDARRVPVKIVAHTELGDLDVDATSYEAPPAANASR